MLEGSLSETTESAPNVRTKTATSLTDIVQLVQLGKNGGMANAFALLGKTMSTEFAKRNASQASWLMNPAFVMSALLLCKSKTVPVSVRARIPRTLNPTYAKSNANLVSTSSTVSVDSVL